MLTKVWAPGGANAGLVLAVLIVAFTALRLIGLQLSATDLYVDEAQYWSWAQHPAWG